MIYDCIKRCAEHALCEQPYIFISWWRWLFIQWNDLDCTHYLKKKTVLFRKVENHVLK